MSSESNLKKKKINYLIPIIVAGISIGVIVPIFALDLFQPPIFVEDTFDAGTQVGFSMI